jgi:hypothetical protein
VTLKRYNTVSNKRYAGGDDAADCISLAGHWRHLQGKASRFLEVDAPSTAGVSRRFLRFGLA